MSPEQFVYWFQGYVELHGEIPTPEQWQSVKDHLKEVFHKVTPSFPPYPRSTTEVPGMPSFIC